MIPAAVIQKANNLRQAKALAKKAEAADHQRDGETASELAHKAVALLGYYALSDIRLFLGDTVAWYYDNTGWS